MIYITGDTHQNIDISKLNTKNFPEQKELTKSDYVIICGDFGMVWNNSKEEMYWRKWLEKKNFTTLFIDGNHENYELLNEFPVIEKFGGKVQEIGKDIFHLMRGEIYTIDGKTFFCMGGGESDDIDMRQEGKSWWKDEMPNAEEMKNGAENLKSADFQVDYVITHEAPAMAKDFIRLHTNSAMKQTPINTYLQELMKNVEYNHWFFGSLHIDLQISKKMTAVFNEIIKIR